MIALLSAVALAAGIHAGVPVHGVQGLGDPTFLTPATGWSAPVEGGWVRVFVGEDEAAAEAWFARSLEGLQVAPPPLAGIGDEARGDGETLVLFRDGNVAAMVRVERGAGPVATRIAASIADDGARVAAKVSQAADGRWIVEAPAAAAVRAVGGSAVPFRDGEFRTKPTEVHVWDAYGRVTVLRP